MAHHETARASSGKEAIDRLMDRYGGETYAESLGLDLASGTPMPLFLWLVAANLFSARIGADQALQAARALKQAGLTTAERMAEATWKQRVLILNRNGYARFDEKTSTFLKDMADHCLGEYGGDLRRLREAAGRNPAQERRRLKAFKGIGDVGADIFFREVQQCWEELYPFADARSLRAARRLGLGKDARQLAAHVERARFPAVLTALVRADLDKALDELAAG